MITTKRNSFQTLSKIHFFIINRRYDNEDHGKLSCFFFKFKAIVFLPSSFIHSFQSKFSSPNLSDWTKKWENWKKPYQLKKTINENNVQCVCVYVCGACVYWTKIGTNKKKENLKIEFNQCFANIWITEWPSCIVQ